MARAAARCSLLALGLAGLGAAQDAPPFCEVGDSMLTMPSGGSGKCYCSDWVMGYCEAANLGLTDENGQYLNVGCDSENSSDPHGHCGYYCKCGEATSSDDITCCLRAPSQYMINGEVFSPGSNPPEGTVTGGMCHELRERSHQVCEEENWDVACNADPNEMSNKTCPGLMATVLELCPEHHFFWDEGDMEWKSTRMDAQEGQRMMRSLICTDCGRPYMELVTECLPDEMGGEGGMGGNMSMCQSGSHCAGLLATMNQTCNETHSFDEESGVLDFIAMMNMMCSPCYMAISGMQHACSDLTTMCEEQGPCANQKELIRSICPADFPMPSETTVPMTVEEMLAQMEMPCAPCMRTMMEYSTMCGEERGQEVCTEGTQCSDVFWGMQILCRPEGTLPVACLAEDGEGSCECRAGNATFCQSYEGMTECGHICGNFSHPACDDHEMSCSCMIAKSEGFCEMCETETGCMGCNSECTEKGLADLMLFSLIACGMDGGDDGWDNGKDGPGGHHGCVSIPETHDMWHNEIWERFTPRRCM